jgi:radical SAM protein with 4Fe4S-binding SPASM domain
MGMIDYTFNSGFKACLYTTLEGATLDMVKKLNQYHFSEIGFHLADGKNNSKIKVNDEYYEKIEFAVANNPFAWYMYHSSEANPRIAEILSKYNRKYSAMGRGDDRGGLVENGVKTNYKKGKLLCICKKCPQMLSTNCLLPNGDIVLCTQDYVLDFTLGNLNSEKYEDIISIDNPRYKEILRRMNSEDESILCRRCCHSIKTE